MNGLLAEGHRWETPHDQVAHRVSNGGRFGSVNAGDKDWLVTTFLSHIDKLPGSPK
jgi:hypothetical protein